MTDEPETGKPHRARCREILDDGYRCRSKAIYEPDSTGTNTKCGLHCAAAKARRTLRHKTKAAAIRAGKAQRDISKGHERIKP